MYINRIGIKNFKGLKEVDIEFQKKFNLIIGNNGVGKSSILDAISVALGGYIAGIDGVYGRHIKKEEIRIESDVRGDATYNVFYQVPVEIECEAVLNKIEYRWNRTKTSSMAARTKLESKDIRDAARLLYQDRDSVLPIICYQGASRMWAKKRLTKRKTSKKDNLSRNQGYLYSLNQESNNRVLLDWCKKMEQISWQEGMKISEYEAVKNAVAKFMGIINESSEPKIFYEKKSEELTYRDASGSFPISYLSAGYQSLIWMVFDIAYRMSVLNPDMQIEVVDKTPGIVLIDEIEVHLHPEWQWKVIEALEKVFPCVQFIATTHSPIVLASAKDRNIIRLESNDEIDYQKSSYAAPIELVLSEYQESSDLPKDIKVKFDKFNEELEDGNIDAAEKNLLELKKDLDVNNPRIIRAELDLKFERFE